MKRYICIMLLLCFLCGCTDMGADSGTVQNEEAAISADTPPESEEEIKFSRDDFVLFADKDGIRDAVIWLGMKKELVYENMDAFSDCFDGIDTISYDTEKEIIDGKAGEGDVEYVNLISYTGGLECAETEKGIRTSGFYGDASEPNSTADDVIRAYGLDPENESIYIGDPTQDNYTIAVYFNIDNNNNVKRMIPDKGTDIDSIDSLPGVDYFIKFMITSEEVTGIQMYRRKRMGMETGD